MHVRVQFQLTRPPIVRRFHFGEIGVCIVMELILQVLPHDLLGADPSPGTEPYDMIVLQMGDGLLVGHVATGDEAFCLHDFVTPLRCDAAYITVYPGAEAGEEVLAAFHVQGGKTFKPTVGAARFNIGLFW